MNDLIKSKSIKQGKKALTPEELFKEKQKLLQIQEQAKKDLRELEKLEKKSSNDWNNVHVFNIVIQMLYDGKLAPDLLDSYIEKTLKEDFQKDNLRMAVKTILAKKKKLQDEDKNTTTSSEKTTDN